jgi:hypothetical protein
LSATRRRTHGPAWSSAFSIRRNTHEIGLRATEDPHHLRDIHRTVLYQLGLQNAL